MALIKSGLHPSEIHLGYEKAYNMAMELLEQAQKHELKDLKDVEEVSKLIKTVIGAKLLHGQDMILAPLIAEACISILPSKIDSFNVENVRVAKVLGASLIDSQMLKGLVVLRAIEGAVSKVEVIYSFN